MDAYDRLRQLGRGSFGVAFLVKRRRDHQLLVMKMIQGVGALEIDEARKEAQVLDDKRNILVCLNNFFFFQSFVPSCFRSFTTRISYATSSRLFVTRAP
jgi:hypothetical protein